MLISLWLEIFINIPMIVVKMVNANINLYKDYTKYKKLFKQKNIKISTELLEKSRRCSKTVCEFIKNKIGIDIESEHKEERLVKEIIDEKAIINTIENDKIVKLFYNNHIKYNIKNTNNWEILKVKHIMMYVLF